MEEKRRVPHGDDKSLRNKELLQFAHDLRNLLLPILGSIELTLESTDIPPQVRARLESIVRTVDRVERLIEDALWLGHESGGYHPVPITPLVRDIVERIKKDLNARVRCLFLNGGEGYVAGSESRLWRALYNLILNSAEAVREGGEVLVRVSFGEAENQIAIDIEDSGPGIPDDIQDDVFSPTVSTKESHLGLGMSVAKDIIEEHRGSLSVGRRPSGGVIATVRFPLLSK